MQNKSKTETKEVCNKIKEVKEELGDCSIPDNIQKRKNEIKDQSLKIEQLREELRKVLDQTDGKDNFV